MAPVMLLGSQQGFIATPSSYSNNSHGSYDGYRYHKMMRPCSWDGSVAMATVMLSGSQLGCKASLSSYVDTECSLYDQYAIIKLVSPEADM